MRVHVLRHVPFEGPALIAEWVAERGHALIQSYASQSEFPALDEFDFLVVLGGPMAADDDENNPWLASERELVRQAAAEGKPVLGICLGAQVLAAALGGRVKRCEYPEIGWFPVRRTETSSADAVFAAFPEVLVVGQWHGDTFDLPEGLQPAMTSDACANQAFSAYGGRVVGVQFHLEWDRDALETLVDEAIADLDGEGPYIFRAPDMMAKADRFIPGCRGALWMLMDLMAFMAEERA